MEDIAATHTPRSKHKVDRGSVNQDPEKQDGILVVAVTEDTGDEYQYSPPAKFQDGILAIASLRFRTCQNRPSHARGRARMAKGGPMYEEEHDQVL